MFYALHVSATSEHYQDADQHNKGNNLHNHLLQNN